MIQEQRFPPEIMKQEVLLKLGFVYNKEIKNNLFVLVDIQARSLRPKRILQVTNEPVVLKLVPL